MAAPSNKRMQLTKLRAAPERQGKVPPCAPAGRMDGGTASQLIRSVRQTEYEGVKVARTMRSILVLLLAVVVHSSERTQAAPPESQALAARLVGHWSLVSFEAVTGGHSEYPFGPDALGQITYDAAGHVAVQIMKSGRRPFVSGDQAAGTVEEVAAAFTGYVAYYGSYSVDERAGVVTHHLTASMFPNWVGSEQRREVLLKGDQMTLSTPPTLFQGRQRVLRLVWKRLE